MRIRPGMARDYECTNSICGTRQPAGSSKRGSSKTRPGPGESCAGAKGESQTHSDDSTPGPARPSDNGGRPPAPNARPFRPTMTPGAATQGFYKPVQEQPCPGAKPHLARPSPPQ